MAYEHVAENLRLVRSRMAEACRSCGRDPSAVILVAVSKFHPPEAVLAAAATGQRIFGESYVQEALEKMETLAGHELCWHHIGKLQRRKAKKAVGGFALIHTLDSWELAQEIQARAREKGVVQDVLVQVNASREPQKSGVAPDEAHDLAARACSLPNVRVRGLMGMAAFDENPESARGTFRELRMLRDRLAASLALDLPELSMGMSGDFEVAIQEGATLVRIGTEIFGERP